VLEAQALAVLAAIEHAAGDLAAAAALAEQALTLQDQTGWRQQRATLERFAEGR
jgi:hypothetical protein